MRLTLLPQTKDAWAAVNVGCAAIAAWGLLIASWWSGEPDSVLAIVSLALVAVITFPLAMGWTALILIVLNAMDVLGGPGTPWALGVFVLLTTALAQWANCHAWVTMWRKVSGWWRRRRAVPRASEAAAPGRSAV